MNRILCLFTLMIAMSPNISLAQTTPQVQEPAQESFDPYLLLGEGSVITQTEDIYFGYSRKKQFCDGKEAGIATWLYSSVCCTLRIISFDLSDRVELNLTAQDRRIKYLDKNLTYAAIGSKHLVTLNCGNSAPSKHTLETAFGELMQVKSFVPVMEDGLKQNIYHPATPKTPPSRAIEM